MTLDRAWAHAQLDAAGYAGGADVDARTQEVRTAVERLLSVWETMQFRRDDDGIAVLQLFAKLARGHALVQPDNDNYTWVPTQRARPGVGAVVRVRADAYGTGSSDYQLNGMHGHVMRLARGVYVVTLTNGELRHFRAEMLETRTRNGETQ